jgi:hypothetical protein
MDKAAAKREYKEAKRPMGVYRIRSGGNGRNYVGFSTNALARMNRHKAELGFRSERCEELQEDWDSFGEAAFQFEVLDELDQDPDSRSSPVDDLRVLADMWVSKLEQAGESVIRL